MWESTGAGDTTALVTVQALDALLAAGVPAAGVRRLCGRYSTWGELVAAPLEEVVYTARLRTGVRLAQRCPPVRPATVGGPVGCFDRQWCTAFERVDDPPVLVDVAGRMHTPTVFVGGGRRISPQALAVVDRVVDALNGSGVGLCAIGDGAGLQIAGRAVGRVPVTLVTFGDAAGTSRGILCGIAALRLHHLVDVTGGCVVHLRGVEPLADAARRGARVAVALSERTLVVEPGVTDPVVDEVVATAQRLGYPLAVSGRHERVEQSVVGYGHLPVVPLVAEPLTDVLLARH